MKLHDLKPAEGSIKDRKRVGRGEGSKRGGTSTRGHKGANSRSGYSRKIGFEGGQQPLQRRGPKFGFTSPNKVYAQLINLQNLEESAKVETGSSIDKNKLRELGFIKKADKPVKLLGKGSLSKKITIEVDMVSDSAANAVKKAGGEVVTIGSGRL